MKKILVALFTILSCNSFAQCVQCKTLQEALVQPAIVKELISNSWQTGLKLDTLPPTIGSLTNLEVLYLADQDFQSVPATISNLKKLRKLSFAGCKLQKLPDEIFSLTELTEVYLNDNLFSEEYIKELKAKFKKYLPKAKVVFNI